MANRLGFQLPQGHAILADASHDESVGDAVSHILEYGYEAPLMNLKRAR